MSHGISVPLVTVVVPTFRGADRIGDTLRSLAHQTMDRAAFEVVVVLNGPADGTPEVLDRIRREHPELRLRSITIPEVGAGHARNAGVASAAGTYLTFVDDDDSVSATMLESLAAEVADGVVPLSMVADVVTDSVPSVIEFDNYLNRRISVQTGQTVAGESLPTALGFVAGKLVPTALARTAEFDTSLRSGEDVVYWFDLFNRAPFLFSVVDSHTGAAYHRSIRVGSISRQAASYDFSVSQRLEVIQRLASREVTHPAAARVRDVLMVSQTVLINGYLREMGEDVRLRAVDQIRELGLESFVRYDVLNAGLAHDLAICYAFPPWVDTSGSVSARRIRRRGVVVDVVSQSLRSWSERDAGGRLIAQEFIGDHAELAGKAGVFEWRPIDRFVTAGFQQIATWEATKGSYRSVYSRSMWPASHFLAALYKIRRPETTWIAEFSDPQQRDSRGGFRGARCRPGPLLDELLAALAATGVELAPDVAISELVEVLAYSLADEIVFTNENQQTMMLDYLGRPALEERVRERSTISEHPTLEPHFYQLAPSDYVLDPTVANVAYFGAFYKTRGLGEVIEAVSSLSAERQRRLRLHVFTPQPEELDIAVRDAGLNGVIIANSYVPYLEALNLATRMDALIINDATTVGMHSLNPYLPSKWSDYAGSGSDVWAIVEPGSVLSKKKTRYQSRIGDAHAAHEQLVAIIKDHV
ncbi:glycosyltransferase [Nocardioides conyzicola]|uniref:Glycosyltransferase 2-like domain-containing protein n=1 Tax=Nocardioides conyzicola TaxID=1651781 RepID=A0ABP8X6C6_9ACTN